LHTVMPLGQTATIGSVEALRVQMLATLHSEPELVIDASALIEVDLALVQLVEAARQHATRESKAVRLAAPANPALTHLLGRAGLIDGATQDDLDFWFHGERPQ
jgi:hypothetical protein